MQLYFFHFCFIFCVFHLHFNHVIHASPGVSGNNDFSDIDVHAANDHHDLTMHYSSTQQKIKYSRQDQKQQISSPHYGDNDHARIRHESSTTSSSRLLQGTKTLSSDDLLAWTSFFDSLGGGSLSSQSKWVSCGSISFRNDPCTSSLIDTCNLSPERRINCTFDGTYWRITEISLRNNNIKDKWFPTSTINAFSSLKVLDFGNPSSSSLTSNSFTNRKCLAIPVCQKNYCNFDFTGTYPCTMIPTSQITPTAYAITNSPSVSPTVLPKTASPTNPISANDIHPQDLKAWQYFYNALGGSQWSNCGTYEHYMYPCTTTCSSPGQLITCEEVNGYLRIKVIVLQSNNLKGFIPESTINSMDYIRFFDLSNSFSGGYQANVFVNMKCLSIPKCLSQTECLFEFTSATVCKPAKSPTWYHTLSPSKVPTLSPSLLPSIVPTSSPSQPPSRTPTKNPTRNPTIPPSTSPTRVPSKPPTPNPTKNPSQNPTNNPSQNPTQTPSRSPTSSPTKTPTTTPSINPTTVAPSTSPTTVSPTSKPLTDPTSNPVISPSHNPTSATPTITPTKNPTLKPSATPTAAPTTAVPTRDPSRTPTNVPTNAPSTSSPTRNPSSNPTTNKPTSSPTTKRPTKSPSKSPTKNPSKTPSLAPTKPPTSTPTTNRPTKSPARGPTVFPTLPPEYEYSPLLFPTKLPSGVAGRMLKHQTTSKGKIKRKPIK